MSSRRKDTFAQAVVGLFMLAVLALLAYFTIIISGVDVFQGRRKVYATVAFTDVGGLKDHDNVMYRGTKVGDIDHISLGKDVVKVVMEIDRNVVLRENCRISVCNLSMLGGNYLLLEEGDGEVMPLETTEFKGETPTDWMRDVSTIAKNINELTSGDELKSIVTNIEAASVSIRNVADRVERGEGTVGKLLSSDETLYNDLKSAVADIATVLSKVREGKSSVGRLLSDDGTAYEDLSRTLSSAADIAERLKNGEGFVGRLLAKDDPMYAKFDEAVTSFRDACKSFDANDVMTGAKSVVAGADKLVENLNVVAERLKSGEGTLGKLVNDPELYNEVNGLMKDARQVLDNFRDTTPISTFGSLIMGGL
jgi:phospholipid/cholesterol/gamma-HCH transport system substrate-binding protein